jgi:nitrate/TMAO reductase-like tetraheme cytochrome c subunit
MPQWEIFKKFNLSKKEDKLKALVIVSGIILALLFCTAGAINFTMSPQFCSKCHVMAPEYTTWKASSHLRLACTDCHSRSVVDNLKEIYIYSTGIYDKPIKMSGKIQDAVCTRCHSQNRDFTLSFDLIIPHKQHADNKILCVDCHNGVAHGSILSRKVTEDGNYQAWTDSVGKKQMAKDYTEPKMNVCLDCHIKRKITEACEACHTSITLPPDHKPKEWAYTHGLAAKVDLEYCNSCHSYSLEAKDVPVKDLLARYARGNVFCYDCHQDRPVRHTTGWKMTHKKGVKNGEISGCLVCHASTKPSPKEKAVPTYCIKCHNQTITKTTTTVQSESVTFRKQHLPNWRKIHPTIVKEKGASNEGCWNCHETTHCSMCHTNKL